MKPVPNLHPFLFALFPVLCLYSINLHEVTIGQTVLPLMATLLFAALVTFISCLLLRDRIRGALLATVCLFLFFSFGHLYALFSDLNFSLFSIHVGPGKLLGGMALILFAAALRQILRKKRFGNTWVSILNILMLSLVLVAVSNIFIHAVGVSPLQGSLKKNTAGNFSFKAKENRPDIYFIILDCRARRDVLKKIYGYDDSPFLSFLRKRGFFVAESSYSSYNKTILSLGSTLNLDYIDHLAVEQNVQRPGAEFQLSLLRQNRTFAFIRNLGYSIVMFNAGVTFLFSKKESDIFFRNRGFGPDSFFDEFINLTPFPALCRRITTLQIHFHRKILLDAMDELKSLPNRTDGPLFVVAHFLLPHQPFVFDETGGVLPYPLERFTYWRLVKVDGRDPVEYVSHYRSQTIYTDRRFMGIIDTIIRRSTRPPVIILQSDHGSELGYSPEDPFETDIHERYANLNAIYLPGGVDSSFNDSLSSVNTFRFIFNHCFGTNYNILPYRCFFGSYKHPEVIQDITDRWKQMKYRD